MMRIHKASQLQGSITKTIVFGLLTLFMTYTPLPILKFILLLLDVCSYWARCIFNKLKNSSERVLLNKLNRSKSWKEFSETALKLDNAFHNDVWKDNLISSKYDYRLIQERMQDLQDARESGNVARLLSLLRAGMLRNFGGISNKRLYNRTYIGTKLLIEEYNKEVSTCLRWIDEQSIIENQVKLDFYHDAKTTIGTTALCLHGGSLFGFSHVGVIKSMIDTNLLPNVIVGSGFGSVVGALVCCLEADELIGVLSNLKYHMAVEGYGLGKERKFDESNANNEKAEMYLKWIDNLKKGFTIELRQFIEYTLQKIGKITFKEAYEKSGKTFNILVYPTSDKIPTLLNFLSTPYITIESAIYCSLGSGVLDSKVRDTNAELKIKYYGEISSYSTVECEFEPPYQVNGDSIELKNSPYNRITELFNVNHFIISISRPYLAPFLNGDWRVVYNNKTFGKKISNLVNLEMKHRIRIMSKFGLLTNLMRWLLVDEKSILLETNHIAIIPVGNKWIVWDLFDLFVQNKSSLNYWVDCGERSVWGMKSLLETRFRMEFMLEEYFEKYRKIN
ncbi:hypothetical protein PICMEDRAFT_14023 [Pichia membranifaciens NRRL Y-2026]|uniref:PNPLA domain-containing protein n=1 Tax=Pichia membranifaciens NRRL Y-2026 TaxID=763406 RepID=A0A1E3NQS6_9ASCO|nr:hypothetical protein PICMEDRAFT_14023 [Pichia membranifaciens NRRL Y-2026]ODQ48450.1 hypothetical protein PICMEDRAFT_14023 [Pichia membranifaciens NRRL Y-2026]